MKRPHCTVALASLLWAAVVSIVPAQVGAQFADLDLLTNGSVTTIAPQTDGRIIVGGRFTRVGSIGRTNIARLNPNGSVDLTWAPEISQPGFSGLEPAAAVIAGGHVYVGGRAGINGSAFAKIDLVTGAIDPAWAPALSGSFPNVRTMALAEDGVSLFVGGIFTTAGGLSRNGAAKVSLASPATVDPIWDPAMTVDFSGGDFGGIQNIVVGGGAVYIAGQFTAVGAFARSGLVKVSPSGSGAVDALWAPTFDSNPAALAWRTGELFVSGFFETANGADRPRLVKLDAGGTGALINGWDPGIAGGPGTGFARALTLIGQHLYIAGSYAYDFSGVNRRQLARVEAGGTGALDPSWSPLLDSAALAVASPDGVRVFTGGGFSFAGADVALSIAELNPVTALREASFAAQIGNPGSVFDIEQLPDESLIIAGDFLFAGDVERQGLLKLNADFTLDPDWSQETRGQVWDTARFGNQLYTLGFGADAGGVLRVDLHRYHTAQADSLDETWDPNVTFGGGSGGQRRLAVDSSGRLYVAGVFPPRLLNRAVARILPDGTVDNWGPSGGNGASSLALSGDESMLYLGGVFTEIAGTSQSYLARVNVATGTLDDTFTPTLTGAVDGRVQDLALRADSGRLYLVGLFDTIDGVAFPGIGALDLPSGAPVAGWGATSFIDFFRKLAPAPNGTDLYVGGTTDVYLFSAADGVRDETYLPRAGGATGFAFTNSGLPITGSVSGLAVLGGVEGAGAPVLQHANSVVTVVRNPSDGPEVTHFQITELAGATLVRPDGRGISEGEFITAGEGAMGLDVVNVSAPPATVRALAATTPAPEAVGSLPGEVTFGAGAPISGTFVQFTSATLIIGEGEPSATLTLTKSGPGAGNVDFAITPGSATPFTGAAGDYFPFPGTVTFAAGDTEKTVTVALFNDSDLEGDEVFFVELSNPTGAVGLASPSRVAVTIGDDEIVGVGGSDLSVVQPAPPSLPSSTGALTVSTSPIAASGQWRLIGEPSWRNSGTSVNGLPAGNFEVEFRQVGGFIAPVRRTVAVAAGVSESLTAVYAADGAAGTGSLRVVLAPSSLAAARWRIQGEALWRLSGDLVTALNAGSHIIEFQPVPGWVEPPTVTARVNAGQVDGLSANYLLEDAPVGAAMAALSAPEVGSAPYRFCGQLQTNAGFATGVVVKEKVVLTVAHAVFDDNTLSYADDVRWFFQKHKGDHEPPAQLARGFYRFDGYAAQREADASPGVASAASQQLDAAAVFFQSPAGRGGSGGFLASDAEANPHLFSAADKLLVGYPVEGVSIADRGRMHATVVGNYGFTHSHGRVFRTTGLHGSPGASGGPLYVQSGGTFYPAGIYLGGNGQALVRAIDNGVVDLINRAAVSSNGGGNNNTGGAGFHTPGFSDDRFTRGFVTAELNTSRGGWRLKEYDMPNVFRARSTLTSVPAGGFGIEFQTVNGLTRPGDRDVSVIATQTATVVAEYGGVGFGFETWKAQEFTAAEQGNPSISDPDADPDRDGISNYLEFAFGTLPKDASSRTLPTTALQDNGNADRLTVTFVRRKAAGAPGLVYTPQFSGNLDGTGWAPGTVVSVTDLGGEFEQVVAEDTVTQSSATDRFGRVSIAEQ